MHDKILNAQEFDNHENAFREHAQNGVWYTPKTEENRIDAVAAGVMSRAGEMVGNRYIWTIRNAADTGCPRDRIRVPPVVLVISMKFDSFLDIKHSEYSRRGGGWDRKKYIKRKSIVSKNVQSS